MATEQQIAANRQNARKSTGPRTPEGKAAVADNALRHGLRAERNVIIGESPEQFEVFRQSWLDEFCPVGPLETQLTERLIHLAWRLDRSERIQTAVFDKLMERPPVDFIRNAPTPPLRDLANTVIADFRGNQVLPRLMIYEGRTQSAFYRVLATLRQTQRLRRQPEDKQDTVPPLGRGGGRRPEGSCFDNLCDTPQTEYASDLDNQTQFPPADPRRMGSAHAESNPEKLGTVTPFDNPDDHTGPVGWASAHAAANPDDLNKQTQSPKESRRDSTVITPGAAGGPAASPHEEPQRGSTTQTNKQTQSPPDTRLCTPPATLDPSRGTRRASEAHKQTQSSPYAANTFEPSPPQPGGSAFAQQTDGRDLDKQTQSQQPPANDPLHLIKSFRRPNPASQDIARFDRRVQKLLKSGRWDVINRIDPQRFTPDQLRILDELRRRHVSPPLSNAAGERENDELKKAG